MLKPQHHESLTSQLCEHDRWSRREKGRKDEDNVIHGYIYGMNKKEVANHQSL